MIVSILGIILYKCFLFPSLRQKLSLRCGFFFDKSNTLIYGFPYQNRPFSTDLKTMLVSGTRYPQSYQSYSKNPHPLPPVLWGDSWCANFKSAREEHWPTFWHNHKMLHFCQGNICPLIICHHLTIRIIFIEQIEYQVAYSQPKKKWDVKSCLFGCLIAILYQVLSMLIFSWKHNCYEYFKVVYKQFLI